MPALIVVAGWHYFWCREIDAVYTKVVGSSLTLACASAFMSLALGTVDVGERAFRAGGYVGDFVATWMAEYLSRMGSMIVILALLVVAVILTTQFSFGRLFAIAFGAAGAGLQRGWRSFRSWNEERSKAKQRRDVIAKHVKKGTASPEILKAAVERAAKPEAPPAKPRPRVQVEDDDEDNEGRTEPICRRSCRRGPSRRCPRPCRCPSPSRAVLPSGAWAATRCRRRRCWIRRAPNERSTSAS
jgi:hypothetical protein